MQFLKYPILYTYNLSTTSSSFYSSYFGCFLKVNDKCKIIQIASWILSFSPYYTSFSKIMQQ